MSEQQPGVPQYPGAQQYPSAPPAQYPAAPADAPFATPYPDAPRGPNMPVSPYATQQYPGAQAYPGANTAYATYGAPAEPRGKGLGATALVGALIAAIVAPIAAAIAGYRIGLGASREFTLRDIDDRFDWSVLAPVRDWVLIAEVSFWVGTVLGLWALIQGIVAIAKNRGRGAGIAALVLAILGPFVFGAAIYFTLVVGAVGGSSIGG